MSSSSLPKCATLYGEELVREPSRHPRAALLDRVHERAHEPDLQVVVVIHRLVADFEPVVPAVRFHHGRLRVRGWSARTPIPGG